jgi:hypothetical protein
VSLRELRRGPWQQISDMAAVAVDSTPCNSIPEALNNAKPGSTITISGAHSGEAIIIPAHLKGALPCLLPWLTRETLLPWVPGRPCILLRLSLLLSQMMLCMAAWFVAHAKHQFTNSVCLAAYHAGITIAGSQEAIITVTKGPAVECSATGVKVSSLRLVAQNGEACVLVQRGGVLTLVGCEVQNAFADGVQSLGECTLEACTVRECAAYGIAVLSGGRATTKRSTITLNTKTGILSRGKGSHAILCEGTVVERNKMHGVGIDQGATVTANAASVRSHTFVGVNVGDTATGELTDCNIEDSGMHGIQCTGGAVRMKGCSITRAGKLGIFINPALPSATGLARAEQEGKRASLVLEDVTVTSCGIFGVHMTGGALHATSCTVTNSGDSGVVAKGGFMQLTNCSVSRNAKFGLSLSDQRDAQGKVVAAACGSVKGSTIAGNTGLGVHCSGGAVCSLASSAIVDTLTTNPPIEAGGSGIAAVLGGLISISQCDITNNANFGIFVSGGNVSKDATVVNASGVSVERSTVTNNGSYGAGVAQATPAMPVAANLRIGAFGCDFSRNAEGEIEGTFTKEQPLLLYATAAMAVLAAALLVSRSRASR